jgi:hypothetical protein
MHPKLRFLFRAVVVLVLSFSGLLHAQVNRTGKVTVFEELNKVAVVSDEHAAVREYHETLAQEWRNSFIDQPPVRFAREPWEPPSVAFERTVVRKPAVQSKMRQTRHDPERGRQQIKKKLEEIRIEEYHVPQALELSEVFKNLHSLARKLDPEERGVNIVLGSIVQERRVTPAFDVVTGKMPVPLEDYTVTISQPLRNMSLRELLDAIVNAAVPPVGSENATSLQYSVEEYAIVFRQRPKYPIELIDAPLKVIAAE